MKQEVDESSTTRNLPWFQVISPSDPRLHCEFCGKAGVLEGGELTHYPECLQFPLNACRVERFIRTIVKDGIKGLAL